VCNIAAPIHRNNWSQACCEHGIGSPPEFACCRRCRAVDGLRLLEVEIFSRNSLAEAILKPSLDLYKAERYRMPIAEIVQRMRRDIRIVTAVGLAIAITRPA